MDEAHCVWRGRFCFSTAQTDAAQLCGQVIDLLILLMMTPQIGTGFFDVRLAIF